MRQRLPILIVCLMIFSAFLVAGCGADDASTGSTQDGGTSATSSSGTTTAKAKQTRDSCLDAADRIPLDSAAEKTKKKCEEAYDNFKMQADKIEAKQAEALKECQEAAEAIPDGTNKEDALAVCEKFQ